MVAAIAAGLIALALAPASAARWASARRRLLLPVVAAGVALAVGLAAHTALVVAALAYGAERVIVRSRTDASQRRLRSALPAVSEGLAAAIRAGLSVPHAFAAIAPGQPAAVESALYECAALLRLGRPLDAALAPLDDTFGPPSLLLRETLRAFHRHGGNVAGALDRAAGLARQEAELQAEVGALTAQGRTSALVLTLLAPCGFAFYLVANPAGARDFLADPRGALLLSIALALEGGGALWLWRLVRR